MSFLRIPRASLLDDYLNPLWREMGVDAPDAYHQHLLETVFTYANDNDNALACRRYMEVVKDELLETPIADILSGDEYEPTLLGFFYSRLYRRIFAHIRKRNIKAADYFHHDRLNKDVNSEHTQDIIHAIKEELTEITDVHHTLSREDALHHLSPEVIDAYKYNKTWFKDVNNDVVLEVIEVLMDAADKGNSLGNKITQQIARANPTTPNPSNTPDAKHPIMLSEFQIMGIVISFSYLMLSVITPLYKRFALGRDDPIINKWSLRYFIPAVILFGLGIVALTVPVTAMWIGLTFSLYSLASNIFKVTVYFNFYFELKRKIKENAQEIIELATKRDSLHGEIHQKNSLYKESIKNHDIDLAATCAAEITELEKEYQSTTTGWLTALAKKEELEVQRIRTLDKITGGLNLIRLVLAVTGLIGVILALIPATMPIGAIISFTVLCIGVAILATHHVNKFHLIHEEKSQAKLKRDEFKPGFDKVSTYAQTTYAKTIGKLNKNKVADDKKPEPPAMTTEDPAATNKSQIKLSPSVLSLLFKDSKSTHHPDPDPDERPGITLGSLG